MRKFLATLALGIALAFGAPDAAQAQQIGLVNVEVGDVTILENVNVGLAVQAAIALCPAVQVQNIAILAVQVARGEQDATVVCEIQQEDGTVDQVIIAPN